MKRVCCFCESWESGGIESFLCNILLSMDLSDLEVDIVAARLAESVFTEPLKARGVRFYELSGKANETFRNHRAFQRILKERQYDVLHLSVYQGLSLAYAHLAKEAGVPVRIGHSHNTDLRKSPARQLKLCLHRCGREQYGGDCTHLWACSKGAAEFLFSEKDRKEKGYRFIPNGIETERFRFDLNTRTKLREELGLGDALVVGNVGRLCAQKNQSFLLEIFREFLYQEPNSRLLLVGEGAMEAELRRKAEELGIADRAIFYGASGRVEQLLWVMDVFAMPSLFEGLPVTGIEAQAAGLPCVFSDKITEEGGLTGKARFLSLSAPVSTWADALTQAAKTAGDRGEGAASVKQAGFDVADAAQRVEEFYKRSKRDG